MNKIFQKCGREPLVPNENGLDGAVLALVRSVLTQAPEDWTNIRYVGRDIAENPPAVLEGEAQSSGVRYSFGMEAMRNLAEVHTQTERVNDMGFRCMELMITRDTPSSDDVNYTVHFDYDDSAKSD